jgi:hypothetical protein
LAVGARTAAPGVKTGDSKSILSRPGTANNRFPRLAVSVDNHRVAQLENFRLKVFRTVAEHLNFRKAASRRSKKISGLAFSIAPPIALL